jgi:hypothetical protein
VICRFATSLPPQSFVGMDCILARIR